MAYSCHRATTRTIALAALAAACGSTNPAPAAPVGPPSYPVTVTLDRAEYAPTATASTDEPVHAGVAAVLHVDIRFPTAAPGTLANGYTGFAVGHPGPVTITAPEGVVIDPSKIKLRGDSSVTVTHENIAFDARLTAPAAGATPITVDTKYALCDSMQCLVFTATLRWSIEVIP